MIRLMVLPGAMQRRCSNIATMTWIGSGRPHKQQMCTASLWHGGLPQCVCVQHAVMHGACGMAGDQGGSCGGKVKAKSELPQAAVGYPVQNLRFFNRNPPQQPGQLQTLTGNVSATDHVCRAPFWPVAAGNSVHRMLCGRPCRSRCAPPVLGTARAAGIASGRKCNAGLAVLQSLFVEQQSPELRFCCLCAPRSWVAAGWAECASGASGCSASGCSCGAYSCGCSCCSAGPRGE